jgi:hypothetical protein
MLVWLSCAVCSRGWYDREGETRSYAGDHAPCASVFDTNVAGKAGDRVRWACRLGLSALYLKLVSFRGRSADA